MPLKLALVATLGLFLSACAITPNEEKAAARDAEATSQTESEPNGAACERRGRTGSNLGRGCR